MKNTAAAWFYGQPGFHGQLPSGQPDISTAYCEVCQSEMGRKCDLTPGVRKCDKCRLAAALGER